jgi:hypothetical protein
MKRFLVLAAAAVLATPLRAQAPDNRLTTQVSLTKEKATERVVIGFIDAGMAVDKSENGLVVSAPFNPNGPYWTFIVRANIVSTSAAQSMVILTSTYRYQYRGSGETGNLVRPDKDAGPPYLAWAALEKIAKDLQAPTTSARE